MYGYCLYFKQIYAWYVNTKYGKVYILYRQDQLLILPNSYCKRLEWQVVNNTEDEF